MVSRYEDSVREQLKKYNISLVEHTRVINAMEEQLSYVEGDPYASLGPVEGYCKRLLFKEGIVPLVVGEKDRNRLIKNILTLLLAGISIAFALALFFDGSVTKDIVFAFLAVAAVDQLVSKKYYNGMYLFGVFIISVLADHYLGVDISLLAYIGAIVLAYLGLYVILNRFGIIKKLNCPDKASPKNHFGVTDYEENKNYYTLRFGEAVIDISKRKEKDFYFDNSFGEMIIDMTNCKVEGDITLHIANRLGDIYIIANEEFCYVDKMQNRIGMILINEYKGPTKVTLMGTNDGGRISN